MLDFSIDEAVFGPEDLFVKSVHGAIVFVFGGDAWHEGAVDR